jgi:hypothetical protein
VSRASLGMEAPGRVELPTRSLGNCCSIHLSYGAIFKEPKGLGDSWKTKKPHKTPQNESRYSPVSTILATLLFAFRLASMSAPSYTSIVVDTCS